MRFLSNIKFALISVAALASSTVQATSCIAYLKYTDGFWQVWAMDAQGQNQTLVSKSQYDKSRLSWYPDASHLLLNSNDGELFKLNLETAQETSIDVGMKGMFDAVVSPNGKQVTFGLSTSGSRDDHNVWVVNLANKKARKLTNLKFMQHLPAWSPNSQSIYFSSKTDDQHNDIMKAVLDGKNIKYITSDALYNFDAIESVNKEIALSSNRTGAYNIWKINKSGEARQLTNRPARDARPEWSADGKQIVFESSHGGQVNIWKINADGSELKQLTRDSLGARFPVWAPMQQSGVCD